MCAGVGHKADLLCVIGILMVAAGAILLMLPAADNGTGVVIIFPFVFIGSSSSSAVIVALMLVILSTACLFALWWRTVTVPEPVGAQRLTPATCPACMRPIPADAIFCPYCGEEIS